MSAKRRERQPPEVTQPLSDATEPAVPIAADPDAEPVPDRGADPARALLARARADARSAPRPGARRRRRPGDMPTARSGSGPDERDPQPFATAMDRLTTEHGWEVDLSVHSVLARWPDLVGPDLAAHCHPEGFSEGVLTVRAESTAWATQLRLLAPQLAGRLNAQVGAGTVRNIQVRGPDAPRWSHGSRTVRGRGPRDTYG
jgi:predicted nucleic acid-binding Zn ribbon protein